MRFANETGKLLKNDQPTDHYKNNVTMRVKEDLDAVIVGRRVAKDHRDVKPGFFG